MTLAIVTAGTDWATRLQQWEYALCNFKPDLVYVDGETERWSKYVNPLPVPSLEELPGELVVFAPLEGRYVKGVTSLVDFEHPTDATYWFGADHANLPTERFETRSPDHLVYVPTDTVDQMYSWVCYAVVAWDRRMKSGNR